MYESEQQDSRKRSQRLVVWSIGGLFLVLAAGLVLLSGVGVWILANDRAQIPTISARQGTVVNAPVVRIATATPRPHVVIAPPEGGIDYESAAFANLYEQVNPSVVNVTIFGSGDALLSDLPESTVPDYFDRDGLYSISSGSGFIWDTDGHIVTNNHVVADADEVQVTFSDGAMAIAEIVGVDVDSDLAVLRIDPNGYNLQPIRRGNQEEVFVGMRVAAIGNPFGLEGTLTTGIVSAMGRSIPARTSFSIPDSIQTDAAINPGNSGGPLLNERGELLGVNAQIRAEERANSGVGFAIPIGIVERVVPALIERGVYEHSYMGISGQTFSPICADVQEIPRSARGAVVLDVRRNTPAARAGVRAGTRETETAYPRICPGTAGGDLIVAIDGQRVTSFDEILIYLERYTAPGSQVQLTILRDGEEIEIPLTLAKRPG